MLRSPCHGLEVVYEVSSASKVLLSLVVQRAGYVIWDCACWSLTVRVVICFNETIGLVAEGDLS